MDNSYSRAIESGMTEIYGLIGRRLVHSYSADIFNSRFASEGRAARYLLLERDSVEGLRRDIIEMPALRGFNVTIPFKEKVITCLDRVSPLAAKAGAVNVVKVDRSDDSRIVLSGYNTDVYGFRESIRPLLPPSSAKAIVLGNGGAARAVSVALEDLGIETVIAARNPEKAALAFPGVAVVDMECVGKELIEKARIIVNTTPLGMWPDTDSAPDIPYEYIGRGHLCYDVVYNPTQTLFMKKCEMQGAQTANGLEMLRLQAEKAWEIWQQEESPLDL